MFLFKINKILHNKYTTQYGYKDGLFVRIKPERVTAASWKQPESVAGKPQIGTSSLQNSNFPSAVRILPVGAPGSAFLNIYTRPKKYLIKPKPP